MTYTELLHLVTGNKRPAEQSSTGELRPRPPKKRTLTITEISEELDKAVRLASNSRKDHVNLSMELSG